jgi:hypothetical protein
MGTFSGTMKINENASAAPAAAGGGGAAGGGAGGGGRDGPAAVGPAVPPHWAPQPCLGAL